MDRARLENLVRNYLRPSEAGETMRAVLAAHADERFGAFDLAAVLRGNPAYTQFILTLGFLSQRVTAWREEDPHRQDPDRVLTERVAGLLGKSAMRNLVCSIALSRAIDTNLPRKGGEMPQVQPSQLLPMALKAEEDCQDRNWMNAELAFQAGLHFDWLAALLAARRGPKDARTALDEAFAQGTATARIGYTIGLKLKQVKLGSTVYAACLLAPLGKALMAVLYPKGQDPAWVSLQAECDKLNAWGDLAREVRELTRFGGATFPELTALCVSAMGILSDIEPALRFWREPERIARADPDQHQLAMILHVAHSLARAGKAVTSAPLSIEEFERRWLERAGVKEDALARDLAKLLADRGKDGKAS
jgi:hypothetical protein